MKTLTALLAFVLVYSLANAAPPDEPTPVTSKITEVTVYADRARVTRTAASVPLGKRVAFAKLPGWLDEGSVRVSLASAGNGELVDVQVLKTFLARPDDEELRKAELAVQDMADQMAALDDERRSLEAQERQVDSIRAFSMDKLPKDTAAREVKVEEYAGMVKFVGGSLLEVAKAKRELEKKRRELQPELNVRQRKLNELRQRSQLEQRTVVITTTGTGAATVALTYMLPGATWEPVHELRTGNGADKVALTSFGVVTQTTGEDWEGVTLSLSTQRSTDTIKIPELEKLLVGGGRALPQMQLSGSDTFTIANNRYSGQIMLWNGANNPSGQQAEFESNYKVQAGKQVLNTARFTALQEQRGTTAHFAGTGPQTVRTDGRPVRVPIGATQLTARTKIVAAPEMSLNAARTAELNNTGKQPLLPGKVLLFVEGAFLGTTETDFVAPGESFPMFLGVADQIKLSRTLDKKRSSLSWSGKRTRMQVSYVVAVENLGDKEVALQLGDRVPVSETDEVRVQNVKLVPVVKPDNKGLVKWEVKVGPKQTQEFRLEYLLDYPADYSKRALPDSGGEPASAPADLQHQIKQLESKF